MNAPGTHSVLNWLGPTTGGGNSGNKETTSPLHQSLGNRIMFPRLSSPKRKHYANWAITVRVFRMILSIKLIPPSSPREPQPFKNFSHTSTHLKTNPTNTVYMFRQQRDLLHLITCCMISTYFPPNDHYLVHVILSFFCSNKLHVSLKPFSQIWIPTAEE